MEEDKNTLDLHTEVREEDRVAKAVALFKEGYNCSQSVVTAFADLYGFTREQALHMSASFGGGIGRMRETCGAACGMFLLAGLEKCAIEGKDRESKAANYALVQELAEEFKKRNGALRCADLLGLSGKEPVVSTPEARTERYYAKRPCARMVEEAARKGCQLIVSHHPVIFSPLKKLGGQDVAFQLVNNGISAICMHTNLDAAPGGVNDTLCDILGIAAEGRESFAEGCGRIGTTMPTTVEALAKFCAATLHSGVKYVNGQKPVTCLAEVSGGGGSYLEEAIARGADCLVTGEAAHHIALLARQKGIGLVVAGHWGTEHAIADVLAVQLEKQFPALTVAHAEADADPYSYLL